MTEKATKTLKIDAELHRQVKIRAAETKGTITQLVEVAIYLYLNEGGRAHNPVDAQTPNVPPAPLNPKDEDKLT